MLSDEGAVLARPLLCKAASKLSPYLQPVSRALPKRGFLNIMKGNTANSASFSKHFAVILLASALAVPAFGQAMTAQDPSSTPPAAPATKAPAPAPEGFWGRVNPWARKKWVRKQTDPINDRLTELDSLNSKNSKDIQDVDARATAGIQKAQSSADAANQAATAAGAQAQQAGTTAQSATGHVAQISTTVSGLDQYHQVTEAEITFKGGLPKLNDDARKQLDDLYTTVNGQKGYILELEGHSPLAGSAGIQSSERLNETVKRYLATEHDIPIFRMHAVALGNAQPEAANQDPNAKPVRVKTSTVHIRLMENSLAAQGAAPPQGAAF
jgi:outer membrane protein OmpA-like peptidoglycan-associated protein